MLLIATFEYNICASRPLNHIWTNEKSEKRAIGSRARFYVAKTSNRRTTNEMINSFNRALSIEFKSALAQRQMAIFAPHLNGSPAARPMKTPFTHFKALCWFFFKYSQWPFLFSFSFRSFCVICSSLDNESALANWKTSSTQIFWHTNFI